MNFELIYKLNLYSILLGSIFVFLLALLVISKNKKSLINISFSLFALSISFWQLMTFFMFINDKSYIVFFDRIIYSSSVFIPTLMYQFGLFFSKSKNKKLLYLGYFLSFSFLLFVPTRYFIDGVFIYKWGVHSKAKILHDIFLIFFFTYIFLFLKDTFIFYKKRANSVERQQSRYVLLACALLAILGPIALLPAYNISIYPFTAYIGALLFSAIVAYAIIKHRLMDIKAFVIKSAMYTIIVSLIAIFYIELIYYTQTYYLRFLNPNILFVIVGFAMVFGFQPIRKFLDKSTDNFFFHSNYNFDELLREISEILNHNVVTGELVDNLLSKLIFNLKPSSVFFYLSDNSLTVTELSKAKVTDCSFLYQLVKNKKSIISEELVKEEDLKKIRSIGLDIVIKIPDGEKCFGILALGEKKSGEAYTVRDLKLLEIIAPQITIAIKNTKQQEKLIEKVIEERQRIQQDAHDKIYNRLGALSKIAETAAQNSNEEKKLLNKLSTDIRQTVFDLQAIVSGNNNSHNSEEELIKELNKICNKHEQNYNQVVEYVFKMDGEQISTNGKEKFNRFCWNLECILQECLNNAGKHSKANKINVNFSGNNGNLILIVKDNGKGLGNIDTNNPPEGHNGLKNITDRTRKLNGMVDFKSSSTGTEVIISIPLKSS